MQSVPDNCFPHDATVDHIISGDFFVGFAHKEDPAAHRNPTSPTVHFRGKVIAGEDALQPGVDTLGGITVYNQSAFLMEDGSINGYLTAGDKSCITMTGGFIKGVLEAQDNSLVTVKGGQVGFGMHITQKGTLTVKGGETCSPAVYDKGVLNLEGGTTSETLTVGDSGTVNLRGGNPPAYMEVYDDATLNVFGTNLRKTLVDAHSQDGAYAEYTLSGTLSDGTKMRNVSLDIANEGKPQVHFIEGK